MPALNHELDGVWVSFHQAVNMSSPELRDWLAAPYDPADAPPPRLVDLGHRVQHVLAKRRTDLTRDDVDTMREVVDLVSGMLADGAAGKRDDPAWRHALMAIGHDPLKEDSPSPDELG